MIHYTSCPICLSEKIAPFLDARDHTVSGKEFSIWECNSCRGKFTQGVPAEDKIGAYYSSEEYISHSDTRTGMVNSIYHMVRGITLKKKRKLVKKFSSLNSGKILDIGCGTGAFLNEMKQAGWEIMGIEPDAGARSNAATLHGIIPSEPEALFHLEEESFDVITMWHVLEHVHRLHDYLAQLKKIIKPGGVILIAVPNHQSSDARHYRQHWAGYDVPRHLYHFAPESMKRLASKYGFKLHRMLPMWFDSFYVSMLSERYKGRPNVLAAGIHGLLSNLRAVFDTTRCSSVIYVFGKK